MPTTSGQAGRRHNAMRTRHTPAAALAPGTGRTRGRSVPAAGHSLFLDGKPVAPDADIILQAQARLQARGADVSYTGSISGAHKLVISAAGKLRFAGKIAHEVQIEVQSGTLDVGNNYVYTTTRASGARLIRPAWPTEISAQVEQWIDFRDAAIFTFDSGAPGDSQRTFMRAADKSGYNNPMRNWLGQSYSPFFDATNRRMHSGNTQASEGKVLRPRRDDDTDYYLQGARGWAYFAGYGFTDTIYARRLFDSQDGNVLFSAWSGGQGGIYLNNYPNRLKPFANDPHMHLWSARRRPNGQLRQDWDATAGVSWGASSGANFRMSVNWGAYRAGENSHHFAIYDIIATGGDLPDDQYEQLRAYTAWHADLPQRLPANHAYRNAPPKASITDSGVAVA